MKQLSLQLSTALARRNIIKSDLIDVYRYGLEILFSSSITSISIIIIATLLDSVYYAFLYFAITIPLRTAAGGYHADTYRRCFTLSNLTYIVISLITKALLPLNVPIFLWLGMLYISAFYIFRKAPVTNSHQPLSEALLAKNKRHVRIYLLIDCIALTLLLPMYPDVQPLYFSVLSIMSVAILIIPTQKKGGFPQ